MIALALIIAILGAFLYVVAGCIYLTDRLDDTDRRLDLDMDKPTYTYFCIWEAVFWPSWAWKYLKAGAAGLRNYETKDKERSE